MSQLLALGKVDLCVAVTRAEHELALMVPMHKAAFGGYQSRQNGGDTTIGRSGFIPTSMLDAFDAIAWRSNGGEADEAVVSDARGGGDLAARIRGRWLNA